MSKVDKNIKYWVEIADYDFETAKALLATRRFVYVGFMCHQVIEKMLKAYWCKVRQDPPIKIHTHSRLAEMTGLIDSMNEDQLNFIDKIESLNIESRYPDYRNNISKLLNEEVCTNLIKETDKIRTWIKERL